MVANGGLNVEVKGGLKVEVNGGLKVEVNGGLKVEVNGGLKVEVNGGLKVVVNGGRTVVVSGGLGVVGMTAQGTLVTSTSKPLCRTSPLLSPSLEKTMLTSLAPGRTGYRVEPLRLPQMRFSRTCLRKEGKKKHVTCLSPAYLLAFADRCVSELLLL